MAAPSRLCALLGYPVLRYPRYSTQIPHIKLNKLYCNHNIRYRSYCSSVLTIDSDASSFAADSSAVSPHPWPEWVNFVDRLKAKGYLTKTASISENSGGSADGGGLPVYTDMKLVKDACLSFARDRFDIFKSLSAQDIQTIVGKGCPNLFRKSVNSSKRLRAYLELDEGDACSSCTLRGSCDKAYVLLIDNEAVARTVDVVRILLYHALDPLIFSGENKSPGRELVESSSRQLLSQLFELAETARDPNLPNPASAISQKSKQSLKLSGNEDSKDVAMKNAYGPSRAHTNDGQMKKGDWVCPGCNFMNYARNVRCRKCSMEGPKSDSFYGPERKQGDWDCPQCSIMNFASNRQCFRCQGPRPQRQMKPGDWECPKCDFVNFSRNTVCRKCNVDRPQQSETMWEKPY